jgi:hypothetical protein
MIRRGASVRAQGLDEVCKKSSVGGKEEVVWCDSATPPALRPPNYLLMRQNESSFQFTQTLPLLAFIVRRTASEVVKKWY